jgi:RNA polymerase sigma-70 factor (ECF subfamily)
METVTDSELLIRVRCGDQDSLVELYDRYSRLVYSVSLRVLTDPEFAEDVLQEIFLQLWRRPEQVSVLGGTLHGWLIIAARNRSISLQRKKCPGSLDDLILTSPYCLERDSEHRLMCEKLINTLGPEQRVVMEMAFLEEMTHTEIASATGYPLGTIKSRIRSAMIVLRKALNKPASVAACSSLAGPLDTPQSLAVAP